MSKTHFYSKSKNADIEIKTATHRHLVNAWQKLVDTDDGTEAETIEAMAAQIAANNEAYAEEQAALAQMEQGA
jgi:hypothetical protein